MQFYGTFYLYAGANFVTMIVAALTIPDNRGLSLARVEQNYESQNKKKSIKITEEEEEEGSVIKSLMPEKV
jgi:hypothetical protein